MIKINKFDDIINLCQEKGEILIYYNLVDNIELLYFYPPEIILKVNDKAPKNLDTKLSKLLLEATGEKWKIKIISQTYTKIKNDEPLTRDELKREICKADGMEKVIFNLLLDYSFKNKNEIKLCELMKKAMQIQSLVINDNVNITFKEC